MATHTPHPSTACREIDGNNQHAVYRLAAKLLRDAAVFFRGVGRENSSLKEQMDNNATVYEQLADVLEEDPLGEIDLDEE